MNHNMLRKFNVIVPKTLSVESQPGNHRWLAEICKGANRSNDFLRRLGLNTQSSREKKFQELTARFIEECRDADSKSQYVVMSSEHLSMIRTDERLQYTRNLLTKIFDHITIIYYMRDPIKSAISMLSTQIKSGESPDFLKKPKQFKGGDHWACINGYRKYFRDSTFIIRRFERNHLQKGDVVTDFYDQCLPQIRTDSLKISEVENKTLSLTGMKLLTKLNKELPRYSNNRYVRQRERFTKFVMNTTADGSLYLPCMEEYQAYEDYFKESCEKIRLEYYPEEAKLFSQQTKFSDKKIDLSDFDLNEKTNQQMFFSVLRSYIEYMENIEASASSLY